MYSVVSDAMLSFYLLRDIRRQWCHSSHLFPVTLPPGRFGDLLLDELPLCVSEARRLERSEVRATDLYHVACLVKTREPKHVVQC